MARKLKCDRGLFLATLLLVCAGVVMVYSSSAIWSLERFGDSNLFVTKQALFAVLGMSVLAITMRIDYRMYRSDAFVWTFLAVVVFLLLAVLFTGDANGATRWMGVAGLGGQPSELAKVACIVFTALMLERRIHRIDDVRYSLLPIALVVGVVVGLVLVQPDFGSAMAVLFVVGVMTFIAGLSYRYVIGGALVVLPAAALILVLAQYRVSRIRVWWNGPWDDPEGYQIVQSLIAVGTGGLFGKGLTQGVQKITFLPEPHTDFIFSVITEELGLLGATGILLCFCFIAWRGLRLALRPPDVFGGLLAVGLTTMIVAQALVNISVALALLPNKGTPLPFISAGGSSLLVCLLAIGVLLNISQHEAVEA